MRPFETRGTRRPPIIDRPRVAYEPDAAGRRRPVPAGRKARLAPVRLAVLLDAAACAAFVLIQIVPGPPRFGLWFVWPAVAIWALADLAAREGTAGGLKARAALGALFALCVLEPLLRGRFVLPTGRPDAPEEVRLLAWWALGALAVAVFGTAVCSVALRRPRPAASSAAGAGPAPGAPAEAPAPHGTHAAPRAPPARAPSRAARVIAGFGVAWMCGGVVESLRGIFWFGLVEIAVGVGWLLCRDTLVDRRTDRRLVRTDRASLLPVLLVPLGGIAALVRAAWLLGRP